MILVPTDRLSRETYRRRMTALKDEYTSSWLQHHKELAEHFSPRRMRYATHQRNRGDKRHQKIINYTPVKASRTFKGGLSYVQTSSSRPWFRIGPPDPRLGRSQSVRTWCYETQEVMRQVIASSNAYNSFPTVFGDMGIFGNGCMWVDEQQQKYLRTYAFAPGSYYCANDPELRVCAVYREPTMTVDQVVRSFHPNRISRQVIDSYKNGHRNQVVEVSHCVEPNPDIDPTHPYLRFPWLSFWWESSTEDRGDSFLRIRGYEEQPFMVPRWSTTDDDVYGTENPGQDALGDAKALQLLERNKAFSIDKIVEPPMKGPSSLLARRLSLLPGSFTAVDSVGGTQTLEPSMKVDPQALPAMEQSAQAHEKRINEAFFVDLWLMLTMDTRQQPMTAREVMERHEEKLQMLGPMAERLRDELLDPFIDRVFGICWRRGLIGEPPPELRGQPLKVEYISMVSVAQKAVGIAGLERLIAFASNAAVAATNGGDPDAAKRVLRKVDWYEIMDQFADMSGIPPNVVLSDADVEELERADAEAAQAQSRGQAALAAAQGAKDLAGAKLGDDNLMRRILEAASSGRLSQIPGMPAGLAQAAGGGAEA